ncbi:MAG: tRNA pseudouridine(13) synthase TruD [Pseudonocardiaceae bacterium]
MEGAVLKYVPTDFIVREVMVPRMVPRTEASHELILLRKSGYTTFEAVRLIASACAVDAMNVTYGGLKDEDAITEQLVALPVDTAINDVPTRIGTGTDQWMEWSHYGFVRDPLRIGGLVGNVFSIVVRNLEPRFAERVQEQGKIVSYIVNYYGMQRFGVACGPKRTHLVGRALLDGDWNFALSSLIELRSPESESAKQWQGSARDFFLRADARLNSFYLAAHSSFVWNELVRRTAAEAFVQTGHLVTMEGMEFLMPSCTADSVRLLAKMDTLPYTRYSFSPSGIEERISTRMTVVQTSIAVTDHSSDEAHAGRSRITLDFFLPSGSYATSAIEQVMLYALNNEAAPVRAPDA